MTRGRWSTYRHRETRFLDMWDGDSVTDVLRRSGPGVERLFICGPNVPSGVERVRTWATTDAPPAGRGGHYYDGDAPVLRYVWDGRPVEVLAGAMWFGDVLAETASTAWRLLSLAVDCPTFRGGSLLSTPASTGRDLFLRSLGDRSFPTLSEEHQELIRSTSGQGRIHVEPGPSPIRRIVEYDGRLMYLGCCNELGSGPVHDSTSGDYQPMVKGRYLVTVTVPADWDHVGILPLADDSGSWEWPSEPRRTFTTWVDGAELHVAHTAGWRFEVRRSLTFATSGRPLDRWARAMVDLLDLYPMDGAWRHAVRAMVLHTIGTLHGRPQTVSRSSADPADVPVGAGPVTFDSDSMMFLWTERRPNRWPALSHPEWSSAVWGRARGRLLLAPTGSGVRAGALTVRHQDVIGFRTDAVYLTRDPRWPDDGRVGRFRKVRDDVGPFRRPTSNRELLGHKDGSIDLSRI